MNARLTKYRQGLPQRQRADFPMGGGGGVGGGTYRWNGGVWVEKRKWVISVPGSAGG